MSSSINPSSVINRTIVPDNLTNAGDIVNYVQNNQLTTNSLIEVFEYNGAISDHNYIIPLVDLWLGFRTDLNPNVNGGIITINSILFPLSKVLEQADGFSYWRASVEPGQFNIYNIESISLNLVFNQTPTSNQLSSSYGMVIKGQTKDSLINDTYKYAFNTINFGVSNVLGLSHSLSKVNTILYSDNRLNYDYSTFNQCLPKTYTLSIPKYYRYAYHYIDFIYNNNNRVPTFLNDNDVIKSQGKTNEVFESIVNNTSITNKYYDSNDELHGLLTLKENSLGFLLGLPTDINTNISSVKFSIDNNTFYDCKQVTETYYDNFNNSYTRTFWRVTEEPILLTFINYTAISIITFDIKFVANTNMRVPVYYTIGNSSFTTNLWYDNTKTQNKIYLHTFDTNLDLYYYNNTLNSSSGDTDKVYMQLTDIDYIFNRSENIINYINQTRIIV